MKHPRHNESITSHQIFEMGYAIGQTDIRNGIWYFRYYDECYAVPGRIQVETKKFPQFRRELHVAKIEKVRFAAHG